MHSRLILAVAASCLTALPAAAGDLIFADVLNFVDPEGNSIRRIGTDGSGLETLIPTGGGLRGLDVDPSTGKVYWTDVDNFVIRRANLNGSNQEDLVSTGLIFPSALRLNLPDGKMYWGDQDESVSSALLDGSGQLSLAPTIFNRGVAIDNLNSKLYWTTSISGTSGRIIRAELDGSGQVPILTFASTKPSNLAIDPTGGKIYWTDPLAGLVRSANLDGSGVTDFITTAAYGRPKGLALDVANGKLYFGVDVGDESTQGWIVELDIASGDSFPLAFGLGSINDMVFVGDTPAPCPADYDGSGAADVPDIFAFLALWFANDPEADFDDSGLPVAVPDIFAFLAAWFAGCP